MVLKIFCLRNMAGQHIEISATVHVSVLFAAVHNTSNIYVIVFTCSRCYAVSHRCPTDVICDAQRQLNKYDQSLSCMPDVSSVNMGQYTHPSVHFCAPISQYTLPRSALNEGHNSPSICAMKGLHKGPNNLCYVTRHFLSFPCFPMSLFIRH